MLQGGSSSSWTGNLSFWGTLLPQKPKIGRISQPPGSEVYCAHRKRHARDGPFAKYAVACERRSTCVDIGQSPLTYLFLFMLWNLAAN